MPYSPVYIPDFDPVSTRLAISQRLLALEKKVRQELSGFDTFHLPLPADSFQELAKARSDAIVAFKATNVRSDAFLATNRSIRLLLLLELNSGI